MKNFVKEGQRLPLYGVGPVIVIAMAVVALFGVLLSGNVLKFGSVAGVWKYIFCIGGVLLILLGAFIWYMGAMRSGMDKNIADNQLKTDGIYAWVRNPMYSGWWILISGIVLMWCNVWLISVPVINWMILTIALKNTEEKWLLDLYGERYALYLKKVNRCIPWKRK